MNSQRHHQFMFQSIYTHSSKHNCVTDQSQLQAINDSYISSHISYPLRNNHQGTNADRNQSNKPLNFYGQDVNIKNYSQNNSQTNNNNDQQAKSLDPTKRILINQQPHKRAFGRDLTNIMANKENALQQPKFIKQKEQVNNNKNLIITAETDESLNVSNLRQQREKTQEGLKLEMNQISNYDCMKFQQFIQQQNSTQQNSCSNSLERFRTVSNAINEPAIIQKNPKWKQNNNNNNSTNINLINDFKPYSQQSCSNSQEQYKKFVIIGGGGGGGANSSKYQGNSGVGLSVDQNSNQCQNSKNATINNTNALKTLERKIFPIQQQIIQSKHSRERLSLPSRMQIKQSLQTLINPSSQSSKQQLQLQQQQNSRKNIGSNPPNRAASTKSDNEQYKGKDQIASTFHKIPTTNREIKFQDKLCNYKKKLNQQKQLLNKIDQQEFLNPQSCSEYAVEIYQIMRETENIGQVNPSDYMKDQEEISERMRAILIDWLIEVHNKFKLLPETMFLTVNIIDRYISKAKQSGNHVTKKNLQLIGITAMLIASKYEEIYPPILNDFIYITDKAYNKEEVLDMEQKILRTLEFDISIHSQLRFFQRMLKVSQKENNLIVSNFGLYLLELSLLYCKMLKYSQSILAASALYLSLKLFNQIEQQYSLYQEQEQQQQQKRPHSSTSTTNANIQQQRINQNSYKIAWDRELSQEIMYSQLQLQCCVNDFYQIIMEHQLVNNVGYNYLKAIKRKYSNTKFGEVSKIKIKFPNQQAQNPSSQSSSSTKQSSSLQSTAQQTQLLINQEEEEENANSRISLHDITIPYQ